MNNAIIIQHCRESSEYSHLLELTFQRHLRYCHYHAMDYRLEMSEIEGAPLTGDWDKVALIRESLSRSYEYVIWLDSDAMIYDVRIDLRGACVKPVNAVIFGNPVDHANTGVLYFKNSDTTKAMVDEWWDSKPGLNRGALAWEQGEFNRLAAEKWQKEVHNAQDVASEGMDAIGYLDSAFNCVDFINPSRAPVVMAWHGYHDVNVRMEKMKRAIDSYNTANPVT